MSLRTLRIGLAGLAAVAALSGGLLLSGALVSAQTPGPTPLATEQAPPDATTTLEFEDATPRHGGEKKSRHGLCDKDGDGQPDGAPDGARGEHHSTMVH